jgi:hypothetical protein
VTPAENLRRLAGELIATAVIHGIEDPCIDEVASVLALKARELEEAAAKKRLRERLKPA